MRAQSDLTTAYNAVVGTPCHRRPPPGSRGIDASGLLLFLAAAMATTALLMLRR